MTFLAIWAIVLGAVVAIGALVWAIRKLVLWLSAEHPTAKERIGWTLLALGVTAYISFFIWGGTR